MPYKNNDDKLACQRRGYARNREKVIASVKYRKYVTYAGECIVCGGPTIGQTKGKAPRYCGKPECKSVQLKAIWEMKRLGLEPTHPASMKKPKL